MKRINLFKWTKLRSSSSESPYYFLCYILLAAGIIALLLIPFISFSLNDNTTKGESVTDEVLCIRPQSCDTEEQTIVTDTVTDALLSSTVFPLSGEVTSEYGWRDLYGSYGYKVHYGIDISARSSDIFVIETIPGHIPFNSSGNT